jgi:hypothetical protein
VQLLPLDYDLPYIRSGQIAAYHSLHLTALPRAEFEAGFVFVGYLLARVALQSGAAADLDAVYENVASHRPKEPPSSTRAAFLLLWYQQVCYNVNSGRNNQEATMKSTAWLRVGVLVVLIVVALASSLWAVGRNGDWEGLALNFGTEMAGAVLTYLLLELVIGRREESEAKKEERETKRANLIAQMGSSVKDVAIMAAEEMKRHSWLSDGSLRGAQLAGANLSKADLIEANLQGADVHGANLQGTFLFAANLQGADLITANLQGADLVRANLQGVDLFMANLQGANLSNANLREAVLGGTDLQGAGLDGTDLQGANLIRANLQGATLNENTILPDGTKWTPDTDMARFTDPKHPDFWRPDAQQ